MARRRRRRLSEGGESIEEFEEDDDLDIRVNSMDEQLQELLIATHEQKRELVTVRSKLDKVAREFEEGHDEDDELFKEIDNVKTQIREVDNLKGALKGAGDELLALDDRLAKLVERLDSLNGQGPVEQLGERTLARFSQVLDQELERLHQRLESRLASLERAREEESDLTSARMEELGQQSETLIAALRDDVESLLNESRQTLAEQVQQAASPAALTQLANEVDARFDQLTGDVESNLSELEEGQREQSEALKNLRSELQTAVTELTELVDGRVDLEEFAKMREELEQLKEASGEQSALGERARLAADQVARLESQVKDQSDRLTAVLQRSEEALRKVENHQDKVSLAIKLVEQLEERARAGLSGAAPPTARVSATPVSDADLELPEIADLNFGLKEVLNVMIKNQATDLLIKSGQLPQVRLDGELTPVGQHQLRDDDARLLVYTAMTKSQRRKLLTDKHITFTYEAAGMRLRAFAFLQRGLVSGTFKLLPTHHRTPEELGLPGILKKTVGTARSGLVLVTGSSGAGKSTAQSALIESLRTSRKLHITTVEDLIEIQFQDSLSLITQREVGTDTESFAEGVREALRVDPDVIVIGHIGDAETLQEALAASDRGHLVIGAMATVNATQTVHQMLEWLSVPGRSQLAANLRLIASLKLLPRVDRKGVVPAAEVLVASPALTQAILEGYQGDLTPMMEQGAPEGMQTFAMSLRKLTDSGLVSQEGMAAYQGGSAPAASGTSSRVLSPPAAPPVPPPPRPVAAPPPTTSPTPPPASAGEGDTLMNWL